MYDNKIPLQNGAWIGQKGFLYDLWHDKILLEEKCDNYSYVVQRLVVVKRGSRLIAYSMEKPEQSQELSKLAEVIALSGRCSLRVEFHDYLYIIDSNCQITYTYKRQNE